MDRQGGERPKDLRGSIRTTQHPGCHAGPKSIWIESSHSIPRAGRGYPERTSQCPPYFHTTARATFRTTPVPSSIRGRQSSHAIWCGYSRSLPISEHAISADLCLCFPHDPSGSAIVSAAAILWDAYWTNADADATVPGDTRHDACASGPDGCTHDGPATIQRTLHGRAAAIQPPDANVLA